MELGAPAVEHTSLPRRRRQHPEDAQRFASLIDDVEQRLFAVLPDDTWVYPGHGKDTTVGAERPHLAEWRARGW
jgi:glyoxylase-like metal-dependent hydrolase (beta-lactamase superfamily II)